MKKHRFLVAIAALLVASMSMATKAPKYVFYFIGDGMGIPHVHITNEYLRLTKNQPQELLMTQFPVAAWAKSYSANAPITDSAAAGTALSTGSKTNNGMLGVTPDQTPVYSVAKQFKEKGYGVAIGTSVPPDDATPAAFYAHVKSRGMFYEIGMDMAKSGYDFFAGSLLRGTKDKEGKPNDLIPTLEKNGYKICRGIGEYNAAKATSDRILLLNNDDHSSDLDYTIDNVQGFLTLKDITKAAIEHEMKVSPDRFFIMIEGGNIDHVAHSNDPGGVVKEIIHFDECLRLAYEFYLKHPKEALIVVTADHNTGGMTLGNYYHGTHLDRIDLQKNSIGRFQSYCSGLQKSGKPVKWEDMQAELKNRFGFYDQIKLTESEEKTIKDNFSKTFITHEGQDTKTLYLSFSGFVNDVFRIFSSHCGIAWTTYGHAGNPVPVFAIGVGAESFGAPMNNTDIPANIRKVCGLK